MITAVVTLSVALLGAADRFTGTPRMRDGSIATDIAASGAPQRDTAMSKRVRARRVVASAPTIDGRLDDAAWRGSEIVSGFLQREPREGAPATERTEVTLLYDENALYIGARMFSGAGSGVRALVTRRDREGSSEQLVVSLDTYRDRRTAYSFGVTPAGVRIDYYHSSDDEDSQDYSYDPVWQAETAIDSLGWTAEIRIPFTQLRFNAAAEQVWGLNLTRQTPARNEAAYWVLVPRDSTGWASRFGELSGISGVRPSRRAELIPYVASDATLSGATGDASAAGDPFAVERDISLRAGGDVKLGLGPGLTLDAAINPDFGQVEADPAEVNLSAFETFFDERRPFFTEGSQLLQPSGPGWFYSRRVGAPPRGSPDADYVEALGNTTILGAGKVTGRLASGLSVGVLAAVTDREHTRTFDQAYDDTLDEGTVVVVPARWGRALVEPRTGYAVARLLQEFGRNASTAGLILTAVRRALSPSDFAADYLARESFTGAADWRVRWAQGAYDWSGYAGYSHLAGSAEALRRLQQSSRHYFQRPDAERDRFDPRRTSLAGFAAGTGMSKMAGHWQWDVDLTTESPGLELNDAGRMSSADNINSFVGLRYRETRPGRLLYDWSVGGNSSHQWNYDGVRTSSDGELYADATLKNFWDVEGEVSVQPRALSDQLTRGGPLMQTGTVWQASIRLENSSADKTQWELAADFDRDELGGWAREFGAELSLRPGTRWELSFDPTYSRVLNARQYVTTIERPAGATATYGRRYIFASVDRSEIAMSVRINYAVTPNLTIESYGEPFASSGRYSNVGELAAPRSRLLRRYGTDGTVLDRRADGSLIVTESLASGVDRFILANRDFNVLSFRSNVVLRWEWRAGSSLYLVWQQDRQAADDLGRRVRLRGLWDSVGARGDNLFAVKITYWLSVR